MPERAYFMPSSPPYLSDLDFVKLLDKLSAAAYTCDPQGLITSFNSRAVELWGRAPKMNDPEDSFCGSYKLFSPDGSPIRHDQCWMAQALHENKEFNGREIVIERPDGTRLTALAHANPIRNEAGKLVGAVNVLVDVGDRKRAEDSLPEVDGARDELLATLAHELRNPLVPIRHMVEYLRSIPEDGASHIRRATDIISAQVNQLTHLLDDLLDLGRIARGAYKVRKAPIDFGAAIKEVTKALRPAIEARGHELKVSVPSEPIIIEADAVRVTQIVSNLLDNANRYTHRPGYISVEVRLVEDSAVLDVRDSGVGIPSGFLPHIFTPFARVDGFRHPTRGGLGLGLSITKTLVEMHGGEVGVTTSGRGSTFTVRLPAVGAVERHAISPVRHTLAPRRILIVDDDAAVADSFSALLESMGHDVSLAPDGASAVTIARKLAPRVAFIDIGLPGMDGYEVARQLRQEHSAEQMLLVAATGYSQNEARSRQAGFDYHLTKPIGMGDLEAILSSLELPAHGDS
jgi:PAS domain S-box-containing protein